MDLAVNHSMRNNVKIIIGICLFHYFSYGLLKHANIYALPVTKDIGIEYYVFGRWQTLIPIFAIISHLIAGKLYAIFDIKKVLIIVSVFFATAYIAMSFTYSIGIWYVYGIISGISFGFLAFLPIPLVVNQYYNKNLGIVFGIIFVLISLFGMADFTITPLIEIHGWRTARIIIGSSSLCVCIAVVLLLFPKTENIAKNNIKYRSLLKTIPMYCFFLAFGFFSLSNVITASGSKSSWVMLPLVFAFTYPILLGWINDRRGIVFTFLILCIFAAISYIWMLYGSFMLVYRSVTDFMTFSYSVLIPLLIIITYGRKNFIPIFALVAISYWIVQLFDTETIFIVYNILEWLGIDWQGQLGRLRAMILSLVIGCGLCWLGYFINQKMKHDLTK